jgi:predicted RNase H-like HicB family nuclease
LQNARFWGNFLQKAKDPRGESMELNLTIELWRKGEWYIAKSPELDFISQGKTTEEAKKNLAEVINIQFQEMEEMGTLEEYLAECGFEIRDDVIIPQSEVVGFERSSLQITR